jgi:F-type H+/Na+-transporting ATPase subunit alpha
MNLRPEEISSVIKQQIENYGLASNNEDVGHVLMAGDGIARIYGLDKCMYGELLQFESGV